MTNKDIIVVGGFIEIIELCESLDYSIVGIIDRNGALEMYGYPVIGDDEKFKEIHQNYKGIKLILTPDKPSLRNEIYNFYRECNFLYPQIISPLAQISKSAKIGVGTVIQSACNVSSETVIGKFVKLNTFSNVMHNSTINDFTTIAPNAVILGHVDIGSHCYIGSNSTILPYIKIADEVTIGAGAIVTKNIEVPGVYAGNPAKRISQA